MNPKVTVVIPVFNGQRFVADAIVSVLAQTVRDIELIVVDDGSDDDTSEIVASFSDARLRCIRQSNAGLSSARNRGVRDAQADLIAFLDADDEWLPWKLEKQLAVIAPGRIVYSDVLFWEEATRSSIGGYEVFDRFPRDREKFSGHILTPLLSQSFVHPSTVLIHRRDFDQTGGFDESLRVVEDWDLWLRLAEWATWHRSDQPLVLVRRRDDSLQSDSARLTHASSIVLRRAAARLKERGELDDERLFAIGLGYFTARQRWLSSKELAKAAARRPWRIARWRWLLASVVRPIIRSGRS